MLHLGQARSHDEAEQRINPLIHVVNAMGSDWIKHKREAVQIFRAVVSEVYSTPRVTEAARRFQIIGMLPGIALNLP